MIFKKHSQKALIKAATTLDRINDLIHSQMVGAPDPSTNEEHRLRNLIALIDDIALDNAL